MKKNIVHSICAWILLFVLIASPVVSPHTVRADDAPSVADVPAAPAPEPPPPTPDVPPPPPENPANDPSINPPPPETPTLEASEQAAEETSDPQQPIPEESGQIETSSTEEQNTASESGTNEIDSSSDTTQNTGDELTDEVSEEAPSDQSAVPTEAPAAGSGAGGGGGGSVISEGTAETSDLPSEVVAAADDAVQAQADAEQAREETDILAEALTQDAEEAKPENAPVAIIQHSNGSDGEVTITEGEQEDSDNSNDGADPAENPDAPPTIIATGDSTAVASVINTLNTNFVNSSGVISFSTYLDDAEGDLDTRDSSLFAAEHCTINMPCTQGDDVTVKASDDATIENTIDVQAGSGSNTIEHARDAIIATGDSMAGLNLINLANLNVVDAQYFLLVMNAFKNFNGDIVFPSLVHFAQNHSQNAITGISTSNEGTVENNVDVTSDSGSNGVEDTEHSIVATGGSKSYTNIVNNINKDITSNDLMILFKIKGTWSGQIFGLPQGLFWTRTDDGILFSTHDFAQDVQDVSGTVSVETDNTAVIKNDIRVGSLSGSNSVKDAKNAIITTGTSLSVANIINIANTNIIGKKWMLAIINIFGDFNGNIAFGRPDLQTGISLIDPPEYIQEGAQLTYRINVINAGDSPSTESILTLLPDTTHLRIMDISGPFTADASHWSIGTLSPGAIEEYIVRAIVERAPLGTEVALSVQARGHETDDHLGNNDASIRFITRAAPSGGTSTAYIPPQPVVPPLIPDRQASLTLVRNIHDITLEWPNKSVHHILTLINDSGVTAHGVLLHDITKDPDNAILTNEFWNIGTIAPGEEVRIEYDQEFDASAPVGTYTLSTTVEGANISYRMYERNALIALRPEVTLAAAAVSKQQADNTAFNGRIQTPYPKKPKPVVPHVTLTVVTDTIPDGSIAGVVTPPVTRTGAFPYELIISLLASAQYVGRKLLRFAFMA